MNNSIGDRANAWSERCELYVLTTPALMDASYHQGATEQKQIDDDEYRKDMRYINIKKQELIDKACEWLESKYDNGYVILTEDTIKNFREAMEE